ncbi:ABC transporter substrate-binding protein [Paenibacillus protaetiae]|nr:ABC transporter substrate-binding protein [Paenibacillus protaetiae]
MFTRTFYPAIMIMVISIALLGCSNTNNTPSPAAQSPAPTAANAGASGDASEASAKPAEPRIAEDGMGNKVEIPANPQRIVAPYLEDALVSLGIKPVAQWSAGDLLLNYLQPQLKDIPKLDFVKLDPEQIASFEPDLFIVPFAVRAENGAYDQFAKVAPTYVFQDATKDWRNTLLTLGDLLDRKDQANEALKNYDATMDGLKQNLQQQIEGKTAAIMLISDKSFSLMQEQTYSGNVVYGELGFQVPAMAKGNDWKDISLEVLPDLNADYIFLMQVDGADPLKNQDFVAIYSTSIWKNLNAVKAGHVYSVDRDYWINTGLNANEKVAQDVQQFLSN